MEIAAPDVEVGGPGSQASLRGADALRAWMEPDAFEEQTVEPIEFRVNGNKVLVHQRTRARGAGSGIELDVVAWTVWTFGDDGLVTRLEFFLSHQETQALQAAGQRT